MHCGIILAPLSAALTAAGIVRLLPFSFRWQLPCRMQLRDRERSRRPTPEPPATVVMGLFSRVVGAVGWFTTCCSYPTLPSATCWALMCHVVRQRKAPVLTLRLQCQCRTVQ